MKLTRTDYGTKQTLGHMDIKGKRIWTLELPWKNNERKVSCIPEAEYLVKYRMSFKFDKHFHLQNVPNRDFVLIHHGNYFTDIEGCILVGLGKSDINGDGLVDVTQSKAAMAWLFEHLPNEFTLDVCGV